MFLLNQDKVNYVFKNAAPIQRMSLRPPLTSLGKQTCSPWHHMKKKDLWEMDLREITYKSSPAPGTSWIGKRRTKSTATLDKKQDHDMFQLLHSLLQILQCYHFKVNHIPKMALNIRTWFKCHVASSCLFTRCGGIESQMCLLWTEHATSIVLY